MGNTTDHRRVRIQVQGLDSGRTTRSYTLTVFGVDPEHVAREIESEFRGRWRITSLSDRRHKRRP